MPAHEHNNQRSLTIQLLRTREAMMDHFRPLLQSLNVTEAQWRVLRSLYPDRTMNASELAHDAAILPSSLTRILKKLEGDGMLEVHRGQNDRRQANIRLSKKGLTFLQNALPESRRIYDLMRHAIGQVRMDYLFELLAETAALCETLDTGNKATPATSRDPDPEDE